MSNGTQYNNNYHYQQLYKAMLAHATLDAHSWESLASSLLSVSCFISLDTGFRTFLAMLLHSVCLKHDIRWSLTIPEICMNV
ncbi:hypothetical protein Hanom_Chr12g01160871 [Helianthus anomalus]